MVAGPQQPVSASRTVVCILHVGVIVVHVDPVAVRIVPVFVPVSVNLLDPVFSVVVHRYAFPIVHVAGYVSFRRHPVLLSVPLCQTVVVLINERVGMVPVFGLQDIAGSVIGEGFHVVHRVCTQIIFCALGKSAESVVFHGVPQILLKTDFVLHAAQVIVSVASRCDILSVFVFIPEAGQPAGFVIIFFCDASVGPGNSGDLILIGV